MHLSYGNRVLRALSISQEDWRDGLLHGWTRLSHEEREAVGTLHFMHIPGTTATTKTRRALSAIRTVVLHAVRHAVALDRTFWITHVNKNVNHVSGWLPLLLRLRFLHRVSKRTGGNEVFKIDGSVKYSAGTVSDLDVAKLADYTRFALAIWSHKPPSRLTDYETMMRSLKLACSSSLDIGVLNQTDSYGFLWTTRAMIIAEMRAAGIKALQVNDKKMCARRLSAMFPDMSGWTGRFADMVAKRKAGDRVLTVHTLLKVLSWRGPVELLTCLLCVVCHDAVLATDPQVLQALSSDISVARKKFRKLFKYEGHPLRVLTEAGLETASIVET